MKFTLLAAAILIAASASSAQVAMFPRHVVTPEYPQLPRTAHVSGELVLLVTIAADGTVTDAKRISGPPLLEKSAVRTVKSWTFDRPAAAPFTQTLVLDYKLLSEKECPNGGSGHSVDVIYDFPTKVEISGCPLTQVSESPQLSNSKK